MAAPELTEEQARVVNAYLDSLTRSAIAKGEPQEEVMEKAGIRWSAGVSAEGARLYLVIEHPRGADRNERDGAGAVA